MLSMRAQGNFPESRTNLLTRNKSRSVSLSQLSIGPTAVSAFNWSCGGASVCVFLFCGFVGLLFPC